MLFWFPENPKSSRGLRSIICIWKTDMINRLRSTITNHFRMGTPKGTWYVKCSQRGCRKSNMSYEPLVDWYWVSFWYCWTQTLLSTFWSRKIDIPPCFHFIYSFIYSRRRQTSSVFFTKRFKFSTKNIITLKANPNFGALHVQKIKSAYIKLYVAVRVES